MSTQLKCQLVLLGALACCHGGCAAPPTTPAATTPDLANILQSAANAENSVVAVTQPAPCCHRQTLPEFLGLKCIFNGIGVLFNNARNCLGKAFPGLEAKPQLLAITDPANMSENSPPAVKAAADIKSQEDQAAQKIKALRYLATIGCGGCYPDVEEAFIAAMEDCTEEVRFEAVKAIRETTCSQCCFCAQGACCTEKIRNKLNDLAYDRQGCCDGESSARVRRQARLALTECGPPVVYDEAQTPEPAEAPPTEKGASENLEAPPTDKEESERDNGGADADRVTSVLRNYTPTPSPLPTPTREVKVPPALPVFPHNF